MGCVGKIYGAFKGIWADRLIEIEEQLSELGAVLSIIEIKPVGVGIAARSG